jgi:hypothetical protein
MLHHSQNLSSNHDILLNDMKHNLKLIFLKNSYPLKLINTNFTNFLRNGPKQKPSDASFTLCVPDTAKSIDFHVQKLIRQIKLIIPNFHVRLVYEGIKLSNIFSADAKPKQNDEIIMSE